MLKNKNFALGTAALLLSTAGFTACSSDDTFTGSSLSGEAVKTQFAINIPTPGVNGRMTAQNTQEDGNFLGMHNIKLIPMTSEATGVDQTFSSVLSLDDFTTFDKTNTKVYQDVNIPVGTTNFLFYGAGNTDNPTTDDERFQEGVLTQQEITGNSTSDITFKLQAAKINDAEGQAGKLVGILNNVANVESFKNSQDKGIQAIYANFTKEGTSAGSAASICKTLESLYNSVNAISTDVASDIKDVITAGDVFTFADDGTTLQVPSFTYPENINMPDGAAVLSCTGGTFSYVNASMGAADKAMNLNMDDVCFPASIYYYANTPLKASNTEIKSWPETTTTNVWTEFIGNMTGTSSVSTTTRAIALVDPIQYGVARLALNAKCGGNLLTDNKGTQVSVPTKGYTITGVLIGGQPDKAGWNLEPVSGAQFTKVVYDKVMNGGVNFAATTADPAATYNYTLVMDNNNAPDGGKVNIAIELTNNGDDFYGVDGIVPAGAKFYLVAQLDPAGKTTEDSYTGTPHVFIKGYTTTAKLTIKSLKNAYNTIPDLRASELSLGLTVDLTWKNGIVFDDVEIQ